MSALRRIKKVKGGYEVTVSCSNKPTLTAFYRTYEQCEKFADDYFLDYLGVQLKSAHHPEGDGAVPEGLNPDSLETVEKALKPVAWMLPDYGDVLSASEADGTGIYNIPLYTAPPKREWVGLTQEEVQEIAKQLIDDAAYCSTHFAIAIEAELRRKNNAV